MAQRTYVTVTSDLSGDPADVVRKFSVGDKAYSIDLTEIEAKVFDDAVQPYLDVAQVESVPRAAAKRSSKSGTPRASNSESTKIREWAITQGIEIGNRGRISEDVKKAYYAGHTPSE